jgi:hypothetical protein
MCKQSDARGAYLRFHSQSQPRGKGKTKKRKARNLSSPALRTAPLFSPPYYYSSCGANLLWELTCVCGRGGNNNCCGLAESEPILPQNEDETCLPCAKEVKNLPTRAAGSWITPYEYIHPLGPLKTWRGVLEPLPHKESYYYYGRL